MLRFLYLFYSSYLLSGVGLDLNYCRGCARSLPRKFRLIATLEFVGSRFALEINEQFEALTLIPGLVLRITAHDARVPWERLPFAAVENLLAGLGRVRGGEELAIAARAEFLDATFLYFVMAQA